MGPHPRRIYGDQLHRLPESRSRPRRGFTATGHGHRPVEEGLRSMAVSTNQRLPVRDRARVPGRRAPWLVSTTSSTQNDRAPRPYLRSRSTESEGQATLWCRSNHQPSSPPTYNPSSTRRESVCRSHVGCFVYQRIMAAYSRGDDLDGKAEIKP